MKRPDGRRVVGVTRQRSPQIDAPGQGDPVANQESLPGATRPQAPQHLSRIGRLCGIGDAHVSVYRPTSRASPLAQRAFQQFVGVGNTGRRAPARETFHWNSRGGPLTRTAACGRRQSWELPQLATNIGRARSVDQKKRRSFGNGGRRAGRRPATRSHTNYLNDDLSIVRRQRNDRAREYRLVRCGLSEHARPFKVRSRIQTEIQSRGRGAQG